MKSRLAHQLAQPGGCSVDEAVRRAEAGIEARREDAVREMSAVVERLADLCQTARAADHGAVYGLATALVDVAGLLDTGPFYQAAYSLCDVADQMRASGRWSWPSVEVHVSALRLVLRGPMTDAAGETLLSSLAAVKAHHRL
jgi:hypothetical protein